MSLWQQSREAGQVNGEIADHKARKSERLRRVRCRFAADVACILNGRVLAAPVHELGYIWAHLISIYEPATLAYNIGFSFF